MTEFSSKLHWWPTGSSLHLVLSDVAELLKDFGQSHPRHPEIILFVNSTCSQQPDLLLASYSALFLSPLMAFEPKPRHSPLRPEDEESVSFHVRPSDIVVDWDWTTRLIRKTSSLITPASPQVAAQFGITSDVTVALITSIFILGYIVSPLVRLVLVGKS
ncbi:hypothetical protein B0H14DRAFT_2638788 [Mycena olivaceomarginata]|nr:hypothetical protein B0H14DRAFT_2638788 [Mycena olivaceomarginata]